MSSCAHIETCDCYRLGHTAGIKGGLEIFTAGENVELLFGMPLEDALNEEAGLERVLEKILNEKNFHEFMVREFQVRAAYEGDRSVGEMFQEAAAKWNAQGEIENAIANVYYHFPLPGGSKGRYHDTLCGENLYWTHVAHFKENDDESEQEAISKVTCPVCIENLSTTM